MILILKVLASYALGSLSGSLLMGKLKGGIDIRTQGSGNAGGTNALRTQGLRFALGVVAIDIAKGAIAASLISRVAGFSTTAMLLCGAAAVIGHVFPVWHGFRGGKGAATLIGVVGVVHWPMIAPLLLVWIAVVVATGFVGLATMFAAASAPLYYWIAGVPVMNHLGVFLVLMAVFIVFTHRSNISRMLKGVEHRNMRLWAFGTKRAR